MIKIDKKYYPLKIKVEKYEEGLIELIEECPKNNYTRGWYNDYLSDVYLLLGDLTYSMNISNELITERLHGKAFFDTSMGNWSFSIFGTDRVITKINLSIQPIKSNKEGFEIYISTKEDEDIFEEGVEESISISFFINTKKFQSIKNSIKNKSKKEIICFFNTKLRNSDKENQTKIKGLYQTPDFSPENERHYKFLLDKTQIINKKDIVDTFEVHNNDCNFYEFPFYFNITPTMHKKSATS